MAHILAVDDDPKILKILQHSLGKDGYEVSTACNGEEAVQQVKLHKPDLVILDIMMPGKDGFETFQEIKAQHNDIPVVILSARSDEIDKVIGFRMGVDDYQTKPFSPTELSLRIKAILRRLGDQGQQKQVLQFDNLTIDYGKRIVMHDSRKVELTPKEFEILWLMASNPSKVFTKANLLDKVWESDFYGDDNTVTVHIRRLREKLEQDPSSPRYIKTVWGIGYKFENGD